MKPVKNMTNEELVGEINLPRHNGEIIESVGAAYAELVDRGITPVIDSRDEEGAAHYALPQK